MENKRNKDTLKIGDNIVFTSGNFEGLSGSITKVDYFSNHPNAIYGIYHTVALSNGTTGYIEKTEHWEFLNK